MKIFARILAFLFLVPAFLWYHLRFLGDSLRFTMVSQTLAVIPGPVGILLRRVWYEHTLEKCGKGLVVDWMAVVRTPVAEVGDHCTFGVYNWIGRVKIGADVICGSGVVFLSGNRQHDFSDTTKPMRDQKGAPRTITLGSDIWIGANAIVMSDVASHTVIGAGAVVTKPFPEYAIIAGNPARMLRSRVP